MARMPTSLRAEKAIQRMRDRAVDEKKILVCRRGNSSTNLVE